MDHGSEGVCELASGDIVLVRNVNGRVTMPGGHAEPGETSEQTMVREVAEEACARVLSATLLGYCRSECIEGAEFGKVIVRDMWSAHVELDPWTTPLLEIAERMVVPRENVVSVWSASWPGLERLFSRIMYEAGHAVR